MSQRNGAPVGVHDRGIIGNPMLPQDGEYLGRERFVHLNDAHVAHREARPREYFTHGGRGTDTHDPRGDSGNSGPYEAGPWLQSVFARGLFGGHDERACTIVDA